MISLCRGLEERTVPLLGEFQSFLRGDLPARFITFVAHEHDGNVFDITFDLTYLCEDGFEFLERLPTRDGIDEYEGVTFGDGESLHRGELVAPRSVCNLQRAHLFVAADDLTIRILDRRDVTLSKRSSYEAQDQRAFADAACAENHHTVVIALFGHDAKSQGLVTRYLRKEQD